MNKEQAVFEICVIFALICNAVSHYIDSKRITRIEKYIKHMEPWNKWF